jgi:hypothetical protein
MCERLKQAVLKTALPERVTGVRIPLPPPTGCSIFFKEIQTFLSSLNIQRISSPLLSDGVIGQPGV